MNLDQINRPKLKTFSELTKGDIFYRINYFYNHTDIRYVTVFKLETDCSYLLDKEKDKFSYWFCKDLISNHQGRKFIPRNEVISADISEAECFISTDIKEIYKKLSEFPKDVTKWLDALYKWEKDLMS